MSKQLLTLISIVFLATQAAADCNDLTLDQCGGKPAFQTLQLPIEEACQTFCREVFSGVCTFFIYDRQQDICQLYDYDEHEYTDSCARIALTPNPSLAECKTSDDDCVVRFQYLQYSLGPK